METISSRFKIISNILPLFVSSSLVIPSAKLDTKATLSIRKCDSLQVIYECKNVAVAIPASPVFMPAVIGSADETPAKQTMNITSRQ